MDFLDIAKNLSPILHSLSAGALSIIAFLYKKFKDKTVAVDKHLELVDSKIVEIEKSIAVIEQRTLSLEHSLERILNKLDNICDKIKE